MLQHLRFLTAGESHGPQLSAIVDGLPAGVPLDRTILQRDMDRRRSGFGRSPRMGFEGDVLQFTGGVRHGRTTGGPVAFFIDNKDFPRWREVMAAWPDDGAVPNGAFPEVVGPAPGAAQGAKAQVTVPRPGHADLAGLHKYGLTDARDVLERASARETAARVGVGAVCRQLLSACGVTVGSHVVTIGGEHAVVDDAAVDKALAADPCAADVSPVRCFDQDAAARMMAAIDDARARGDTVGGAFEVRAYGLPLGLGSPSQADRRLSARLLEMLGSLQSVKAVEIGRGVDVGATRGSALHDPIQSLSGPRQQNNAGGLEGGMTNGMPLVLRAHTKPLSTLVQALPSVDVKTGATSAAHVERSDVCAVPAAAVVGEALVCIALVDALLEKFGGDSLPQLLAHMQQSAVRL